MERVIEGFYNVGLLLSLRGVLTVVCNQYSVSSVVNCAMHRTLVEALAAGEPAAQAIADWRLLSKWIFPKPFEAVKKVPGKVEKPPIREKPIRSEQVQAVTFSHEVGGVVKEGTIRKYDKYNPLILGLAHQRLY